MTKTIGLVNSIIIVAIMTMFMVLIDMPQIQEDKTESLYEIEYKTVDRQEILKRFLDKYNSPLTTNVDTFIRVADKYNLDYKLLPAISCLESTCGRYLIPASYNPFGWGGGLIYFESYDDAIEKVAKGLDEIYLARGLDTPEEIAPVYAPPNHTNWLRGVYSFMDQMDKIALDI